MKIKAHIPNAITLINLFCGCIALVFIARKDFEMTFLFVSLGIFFDFFDGFFARKFNVSGPLGVQLDSLADMVTSGVIPGFVMFQLINATEKSTPLLPYFGFLITLGACYRLANFNIDTRQSDSFIGLPTPANTLFIISLPFVKTAFDFQFFSNLLSNQWIFIGITLLSVYIMNAEIPLFSLKIKDFSVKKYALQLSFLMISIIMITFLRIVAVPAIILIYILISVVNNQKNKL